VPSACSIKHLATVLTRNPPCQTRMHMSLLMAPQMKGRRDVPPLGLRFWPASGLCRRPPISSAAFVPAVSKAWFEWKMSANPYLNIYEPIDMMTKPARLTSTGVSTVCRRTRRNPTAQPRPGANGRGYTRRPSAKRAKSISTCIEGLVCRFPFVSNSLIIFAPLP